MFTVEFTSRQYAAAVLALLQDARTTSRRPGAIGALLAVVRSLPANAQHTDAQLLAEYGIVLPTEEAVA